jgi:nucleotide-binding universal stress UspA family protein
MQAQPHTAPGTAETAARAPLAVAQLREILFASDLSPASDAAFDHARRLAHGFGAHLTLYHAVEVHPRPRGGPRDPRLEYWRRRERLARETLARMAGDRRPGVDVVVEQTTNAQRSLLARIDTLQPDLTVMATHGREGSAHFVLGSTTESALECGPGPVLCVRERAHGHALDYRRVLLPTDLSTSSTGAFPMAFLVASRFEAEVLAVYVATTPRVHARSGAPDIVEAAVPSERVLRRFVEPWFGNVRVHCCLEAGEPWERLVDLAWSEHADLIVMATRGHDSLAERFLGSQTERVVRHAPCPVLVTR